MKKPKVVLPANIFDALELSAIVHGGIGAGCLSEDVPVGTVPTNPWDDDETEQVPSCIIGHALFLDGYSFSENAAIPGESPVCDALVEAFPALADEIEDSKDFNGIVCAIERVNDQRVESAETYKQRRQDREPTVTWKQWCKLMRVVRGT